MEKRGQGAEWVRGIAEDNGDARFALVGANFAETRTVMVEGESGLLSIAPPALRPSWEPSLKRLRWKNGAEARLYSAAEPEGLRGPQHSHAWCDEIAKWMNNAGQAKAAWDNLKMGLRLGPAPQIVATTTPRPVSLVNSYLFDQRSTLSVSLHNSVMTLNDADETQLSGGNNIALVGQEFIQFGQAKPLGNDRFELSNLRRGLGGTERYIDKHVDEEDFLLFESASATPIPTNFFDLFQVSGFLALGRGDDQPVAAEAESPGLALKPWSPVHCRYQFNVAGDLELFWVRRSRSGSSWLDYVDASLVEETEEYQIVWEDAQGVLLGIETNEMSGFVIPEQQLASYRNAGVNRLKISIRQIGQYTLSDPANIEAQL